MKFYPQKDKRFNSTITIEESIEILDNQRKINKYPIRLEISQLQKIKEYNPQLYTFSEKFEIDKISLLK